MASKIQLLRKIKLSSDFGAPSQTFPAGMDLILAENFFDP
jgi:hypothetical protein